MKYLAAVLGLVVVFIMALLGIIYSRKPLEFQLTKSNYFGNIKDKVSSDVLKESKANIVDTNKKLDQTRKKIENRIINVKITQVTIDGRKAELNTCNNDLRQIMAEIDALKIQQKQTDLEFHQNKTSLKEKINNFKIQLEKRSQLCDYIMKRSIEGMKLCGIVPVLKAAQKPKADNAAY